VSGLLRNETKVHYWTIDPASETMFNVTSENKIWTKFHQLWSKEQIYRMSQFRLSFFIPIPQGSN
jgi:hypothetical protein